MPETSRTVAPMSPHQIAEATGNYEAIGQRRERRPIYCPETDTINFRGIHAIGALFWGTVATAFVALALAVMP